MPRSLQTCRRKHNHWSIKLGNVKSGATIDKLVTWFTSNRVWPWVWWHWANNVNCWRLSVSRKIEFEIFQTKLLFRVKVDFEAEEMVESAYSTASSIISSDSSCVHVAWISLLNTVQLSWIFYTFYTGTNGSIQMASCQEALGHFRPFWWYLIQNDFHFFL